ncbi:MAG: hypothetical protein QGH33_11260 [Pirellulaceae bacterium]|nr:hypothetical protein [Pirellulaceae bacterium]HJN10972.1 hypothetical protein [Pirellulaceae bacterium]
MSSVEFSVPERAGTKLNVAGCDSELVDCVWLSPLSGIVVTIAADSREVVINDKDGSGNDEANAAGAGRVVNVVVSRSGEASNAEGGTLRTGALVTADNVG